MRSGGLWVRPWALGGVDRGRAFLVNTTQTFCLYFFSWLRIESSFNEIFCLRSEADWPDQFPTKVRKKTNYISVAEPVEPKLFRDLEPELKINFNEHFLQSVLGGC